MAGEPYEGKARWQHDGVSRQETPDAWVKAEHHDTRGVEGTGLTGRDPYKGGENRLNYETSTCSLCGAWRGQYGLEPTPELYVEHTLMWLREVRRVLRKDGTLWLNLGDGYWGGKGQSGAREPKEDAARYVSGQSLQRGEYTVGVDKATRPSDGRHPVLKPKDAVLMPFRVALAAQAEGFWVRSVIIWAKPNPMPESVRDRPTDAHEYIFLLTKSKTYWYDQDAVREHTGNEMSPEEYAARTAPGATWESGGITRYAGANKHDGGHSHPHGRNCRSVWTFPTEPYPDAHFAVFPRELPERCIKAGCPEWVCPKCGKARVRMTENKPMEIRRTDWGEKAGNRTATSGTMVAPAESTTTGWTDCGCGAGFVGGVVLDPFAGSGTTCEVAYHLGRTAIGIDASAKYLDMAIERVKQGVLV
jgi:DNA modification methylase